MGGAAQGEGSVRVTLDGDANAAIAAGLRLRGARGRLVVGTGVVAVAAALRAGPQGAQIARRPVVARVVGGAGDVTGDRDDLGARLRIDAGRVAEFRIAVAVAGRVVSVHGRRVARDPRAQPDGPRSAGAGRPAPTRRPGGARRVAGPARASACRRSAGAELTGAAGRPPASRRNTAAALAVVAAGSGTATVGRLPTGSEPQRQTDRKSKFGFHRRSSKPEADHHALRAGLTRLGDDPTPLSPSNAGKGKSEARAGIARWEIL
jgi:hypothetical protein